MNEGEKMNSNEKYEYIFFLYIFNKLNLKNYENYCYQNGIKIYDGENTIPELRFSKYFSLQNTGKTEYFSEDEKIKFNKYFELEIQQILSNNIIYSEVLEFVKQTYNKYFFSKLESKYKYYGPSTMEYIAPSDAITLGFNYTKFNVNEEVQDKNENIICDMINEIQFKVAKENNLKIAIIPYNEIVLNQPFTKI